jgi:hypothetical protein
MASATATKFPRQSLLLKQPGALLHGIHWTADPDDGKVSAARLVGSVHSSLSRHFGATEDARPAKFSGQSKVLQKPHASVEQVGDTMILNDTQVESPVNSAGQWLRHRE